MTDEFYGLANIHCYGLCDYLHNEYPELTRKEITICGMLAIGLDVVTVCMLAGYDNVASYYNKRSAIRRSMGLDPAVKLETFLTETVRHLEEEDNRRFSELFRSI